MKVNVTDMRFIDDNSRLEKKIGKRIRHALGDIVGLKQAAFRRLANIARRDILRLKIVRSVAGDRVHIVHKMHGPQYYTSLHCVTVESCRM